MKKTTCSLIQIWAIYFQFDNSICYWWRFCGVDIWHKSKKHPIKGTFFFVCFYDVGSLSLSLSLVAAVILQATFSP